MRVLFPVQFTLRSNGHDEAETNIDLLDRRGVGWVAPCKEALWFGLLVLNP